MLLQPLPNHGRKLLLVFFLLFVSKAFSQEDSLRTVLNSSLPDSSRAEAALRLCMIYSSNSPEECLPIADKGIELAGKKGNEKNLPALLKLKGVAYVNMGDYKESAECYFKGLAIAEKQNNQKEIGAIYNNLGVNFWYQKDYKNALKYHQRSLECRIKLGNAKEISKSYNNLGIVEVDMGNYQEALGYYQKAMRIKDSLNDNIGIANALNNIGIVYEKLEMLNDAKIQYDAALAIFRKEGDKRGELVCMNNIAAILKNTGKYAEAYQLAGQALPLAKEIADLEDLRTTYEALAMSSYHLGKYKEAYEHLQNYLLANDTLTQQANFKTVQEMEKKYNTEKQKQEIELLKKDSLIKDIEISKAETRKRFLLGIILLALVIIGISLYSFLKIRNQNTILATQKQNIEQKNTILEIQKKEILDSINYAKRIQDAMLKDEEYISKHLPPHFILFKPKDIVSGDFYWGLEKGDHLYFAAADCTGHGVPGAFLTLLGTSFLNEINAVDKLLSPAEILDQLRDRIVKELSQQGRTRDGMDISLIRINLKTLEAAWAGAYNPLWVINENGNFSETLGDKHPVGYFEDRSNFTDHHFKFNKGDQLFMFSDGYADQFGGKDGKKFKYRQLKDILLESRRMTPEEQKKRLDDAFYAWKGNLEQLDDVLVIGIHL